MTSLVIGANGYLGSHVTRQLVAAGEPVRVMVREGATTIGIDDLDTERFIGDIWDNDTLTAAMTGCDDVYYCVVDARGWLPDPAPLFHTNVEGTRNVLDVAAAVHRRNPLRRFVFTSSYATVESPPRPTSPARPTSSPTNGAHPLCALPGAGREHGARSRPRRRAARGGDVRVDHLRPRGLGPHPARRDHRRRGLRQAAVRAGQYRTRGRRASTMPPPR